MKKECLLNQIGGITKLEILLRDFYDHAHADEIIGPIFQQNVEDWEYHIEKVIVYWRRQTEGEPNLRQSFPSKHLPLNLERKHFDRWLLLFKAACKRNLKKAQQDQVFNIAEAVAQHLYQRITDTKY